MNKNWLLSEEQTQCIISSELQTVIHNDQCHLSRCDMTRPPHDSRFPGSSFKSGLLSTQKRTIGTTFTQHSIAVVC